MIEILTASVVAAIVLIGLGTMEAGRTKMEQEVLQRSGLTSEEGQVALATVRMTELLTSADRFSINNGIGSFQFRIPDMQTGPCAGGVPAPSCFDDPANYRWDQYRLTAGELRLYTNTGGGCGNKRVVARNVTLLAFTYRDQAPAPPGGDPAVQDNNLLEYGLTWDNGLAGTQNRTRQFAGRIVSRAIPYSDVGTTASDSGFGLSPAAVSTPPGACP